MRDGEAAGAELYDARGRRTVRIHARATLLATGGLGCVYRNTTNPEVATGDGVALAWRAGAEISDLEFVQFHPTALRLTGAPCFLLSEALRGEGAVLRNSRGERFMERVHPMKELAPRDVVARAIVAEMKVDGAQNVYLDLTPRGTAFIRERFPRIYETCLKYGIDLGRQPAPVAPAAHYAMGGVRTDLNGRTSIQRLFAAGEVACSGVHGANRLASNSLLEAVVFGARSGRAMRETVPLRAGEAAPPAGRDWPGGLSRSEVQTIAWERCGIVRTGEGLRDAISLLEKRADTPCDPESSEARNMQQVAALIARGALAREESRGAHFRTDYPAKNAAFELHSVLRGADPVTFRRGAWSPEA